jgi:type II secretory pathway pseudopilin PulG
VTTGPPPPAWYADPGGSGGLRYWDGQKWTEHVAPPPSSTPGFAAPTWSTSPTPPASPGGRTLWPLVAVVAGLLVVGIIAGVASALPRLARVGGRVTDEAAQSSALRAIDAAQQVYALDGSYLGATAERLSDIDDGLAYTDAPSTDFTTASIHIGEGSFTAAVASLSGRCFVATVGDGVGAVVVSGRLGDDRPCWGSFAAEADLVPVDGF